MEQTTFEMEGGARPEKPFRSFIRDLRDAMGGKERDYTSGNMVRTITLLAIPMVLEMFMESVFAVVDVFFVARLGASAIAILGLTETVFTLIYAVAIGLSMAATAMVARRVGEKDIASARIAAIQAVILGVLASLPISVVGIVYAPEIMMLMGAEPEVVAVGRINMAIMLGGNGVVMLLFLINSVFRGAGNPSFAMRTLWLANICNIVLDPCFIFGLGPFPELGVAGAAVATTVGRGIGVLFGLYTLFKGRGLIRIERFVVDWSIIARLVRVSIGGIFQWIIATTSWIAIVRVVAVFGSNALAGYTIGIRIIVFALLPAWGMCNAAATLVGQNLGAGKPDRAEHSVWMTSIYNMVFLGSVALLFVVFAHPLVNLFSQDPEILTNGVLCLRIISYGFVFIAMGMVITQSFNGAGDTYTPTVIFFFCYWAFQIPMAYMLALPVEMGPSGVFVSCALAETALAVVGFFVFRRGRWKLRKI